MSDNIIEYDRYAYPSGQVEEVGANPMIQEQPKTEDPADFFRVIPNVGHQSADYAGARAHWDKMFIESGAGRELDNMDDYIEYIKSIGSYAPTDSYAKSQALKHMPPRIKEEYKQMQEQKKREAEIEKERKRIDEWNADEKNKGNQRRMGYDGKAVKVQGDEELDPYDVSIKSDSELLKSINDLVVDNDLSSLNKADQAFRLELMADIREARAAKRDIRQRRRMGDEAYKKERADKVMQDYASGVIDFATAKTMLGKLGVK